MTALVQAISRPRARRAEVHSHDEAREVTLQALMVTDLVGFTELLVRLGDHAARSVMRIHNRLLRASLAAHGGVEVTHTGDGVFGTFRSARAALACAADIHRAMDEHTQACPDSPLCVRIGIHLGEPLPEDGRLFGSCVNTTVRICTAAADGCTLVSDLVRRVSEGSEHSFQERGPILLKGLSTPTTLHEVLPVAAREAAR